MTLGERIAALRSKHHMSQGDLAERLGVSRQSISKWETNSSVPDLDKLIALSDLFQVSLDELIRGPLQPNSQLNLSPQNGTPIPKGSDTETSGKQRTIGFILIAASLFCMLLSTLYGEESNEAVVLFMIAFLLFLSGTICLLAKRHAGIFVAWIIGVPLTVVGSAIEGVAGGLVFLLLVIITFRLYYTS